MCNRLTENDKAILNRVRKMRWEEIIEDDLFTQCDDEALKYMIHRIAVDKYHNEENEHDCYGGY